MHKWLPAGPAALREIAPGILATLLLWLVSGIVFGRYLADFASTYVTYYAGLASVMIALVFLYLTRVDLHLRRRAQRRDRAHAREQGRATRSGAVRDVATRVCRRDAASTTSSKLRKPGARRVDQHRHVAGLMLVLPHHLVRERDLLPGNTSLMHGSMRRSSTNWLAALACLRCANASPGCASAASRRSAHRT